MAFKKIEKFSRLVEFESKGDFIEGKLVKITSGKTQYGDAEFLQIETVDDESGEVETVSVALGAALQGYDWPAYFGAVIRITFEGIEKSKNHKGKTFKVFTLEVDEDTLIF